MKRIEVRLEDGYCRTVAVEYNRCRRKEMEQHLQVYNFLEEAQPIADALNAEEIVDEQRREQELKAWFEQEYRERMAKYDCNNSNV